MFLLSAFSVFKVLASLPMGANSSVGSEQDRDRVLRRVSPQFSQDEGQAIKKLFVAIAGPERNVYVEASLKAST